MLLSAFFAACALATPFTLDEPPPVEVDPFEWAATASPVEADAGGNITLRLVIPPSHFVYRDRVSIDVVDPAGLLIGEVMLPPGELRPDVGQDLPDREQYASDVFFTIPLSAAQTTTDGLAQVSLEVRHQGCRPGLCFPPTTTPLTALVPVRTSD